MDDASKFIQRENIAWFARTLDNDRDQARRAMVRDLLIVEENKFGYYSQLLDTTNKILAEREERVKPPRTLVERGKVNGEDVREEEQLLSNMLESLDIFARFRERLIRQMP